MKTKEQVLHPDTRTQAQKDLDEAVANAAESGNWEGLGFETTELLTEEGARQIIEFCDTIDSNSVLSQICKQPFRWKQFVFQILRCEYRNGEAHVDAIPNDPEFVAEVKKRIEENRFHYLPYYHGYGFISFPEDYLRYKD
jgi:hypothetical protein